MPDELSHLPISRASQALFLVPSFPLLRSHASSELVTAADSAGGVAWMTHVGSSSAVPPALPAFPLRSVSPGRQITGRCAPLLLVPIRTAPKVDVISRVNERRSGELRWTRTARRRWFWRLQNKYRIKMLSAPMSCPVLPVCCPRSSPSTVLLYPVRSTSKSNESYPVVDQQFHSTSFYMQTHCHGFGVHAKASSGRCRLQYAPFNVPRDQRQEIQLTYAGASMRWM